MSRFNRILDVGVPHAFGKIPVNIGAGLLPAIWGLAHGILSGVLVQLAVGALWVGGVVLRRNPDSLVSALGLGFIVVSVAAGIAFAMVADRLAWEKNPGKWTAHVYSRNQRLWTMAILLYLLVRYSFAR